jgi:hypothetical protein
MPGILAVFGVILIIYGMIIIPHQFLFFSDEAAAFMVAGGVFLTTGFLIHSQVSRKSSRTEKAYALLISAAMMLVVISIVVYMIVQVEFFPIEVVSQHGPYAETLPIKAYLPIVHHIYEELTAVLALTALSLTLNAFYIRSRMP